MRGRDVGRRDAETQRTHSEDGTRGRNRRHSDTEGGREEGGIGAFQSPAGIVCPSWVLCGGGAARSGDFYSRTHGGYHLSRTHGGYHLEHPHSRSVRNAPVRAGGLRGEAFSREGLPFRGTSFQRHHPRRVKPSPRRASARHPSPYQGEGLRCGRVRVLDTTLIPAACGRRFLACQRALLMQRYRAPKSCPLPFPLYVSVPPVSSPYLCASSASLRLCGDPSPLVSRAVACDARRRVLSL